MRVLNTISGKEPAPENHEPELKRFYKMVLNRGMEGAAMSDNELLKGLNDADRALIIRLMDKIRQLSMHRQGDSGSK